MSIILERYKYLDEIDEVRYWGCRKTVNRVIKLTNHIKNVMESTQREKHVSEEGARKNLKCWRFYKTIKLRFILRNHMPIFIGYRVNLMPV